MSMQTLAVSVVALLGVAVANNEPYHSGAVHTVENFQYGRFRTRMRASGKKGTVSSFFTYAEGGAQNISLWNEIDVEIVPT